MLRRLFILPLLLLTACAGSSGDKYPYAPQFVSVEDVCPCELGAPPAVGSKTQKKEIAWIIAAQHKLTPAQKAQIMDEDHIRPEMIVTPVLGTQFTKERYPALYTLLAHTASDAWRIGDSAQDFWDRKRPWVVDKRVQLLVSSITRPSYPSGHSTTNYAWAQVLGTLFPAKQAALYKRAQEIGMDRVKAGVHYPSDVAAGKRFAAQIYAVMQKNPEFQKELAAARKEIASTPTNDNIHAAAKTPANCNKAGADTMVMCK